MWRGTRRPLGMDAEQCRRRDRRFRAASVPRGVTANPAPGTDAGRNGPTDAAEGGPN
jgi:hypothetical protein